MSRSQVPGSVWAFEQELVLGPLTTPIRAVAVRLRNGDVWLHAPVAPTEEFFAQVEELGRVRYIGR